MRKNKFITKNKKLNKTSDMFIDNANKNNQENLNQNENVKEFRRKICEDTQKNKKKLTKNQIDKIFREIDEKLNGKPDLY